MYTNMSSVTSLTSDIGGSKVDYVSEYIYIYTLDI